MILFLLHRPYFHLHYPRRLFSLKNQKKTQIITNKANIIYIKPQAITVIEIISAILINYMLKL